MSRPRLKCHVFIDFDGTIVPRDASDFLFETFAEPAWHDVEREWREGRIGSRECMARQVALLRATPQMLDDAIATLTIDPGFAAFVRLCQGRSIGVSVLSDGFDRVIAQVLSMAGVRLPYFANRLVAVGSDRWRIAFPYARSDCRALAGNCKCAFTEAYAGAVKVVIGDGRSDHCVATRADLVFAKSELVDLCRSSGTPYFAFADFHEVGEAFAAWVENVARGEMRPAAHDHGATGAQG